jgi:hypothetical protein
LWAVMVAVNVVGWPQILLAEQRVSHSCHWALPAGATRPLFAGSIVMVESGLPTGISEYLSL